MELVELSIMERKMFGHIICCPWTLIVKLTHKKCTKKTFYTRYQTTHFFRYQGLNHQLNPVSKDKKRNFPRIWPWPLNDITVLDYWMNRQIFQWTFERSLADDFGLPNKDKVDFDWVAFGLYSNLGSNEFAIFFSMWKWV